MTISLDLAKKLDKKGLRLETEKWFQGGMLLAEEELMSNQDEETPISAPSTDELLEVMPHGVYIKKILGKFDVYFPDPESKDCSGWHNEYDEILAQALGLMCLWLLDNSYHYNSDTKRLEPK